MPKGYGSNVRLETKSDVLSSMTRMMDWHKSSQKDEQILSKSLNALPIKEVFKTQQNSVVMRNVKGRKEGNSRQ